MMFKSTLNYAIKFYKLYEMSLAKLLLLTENNIITINNRIIKILNFF
jgi:hypothetical protein